MNKTVMTILAVLGILMLSLEVSALIMVLNRRKELKNANWFVIHAKSSSFVFIPIEMWNDAYLQNMEVQKFKRLEESKLVSLIIKPEQLPKLRKLMGDETEFESLKCGTKKLKNHESRRNLHNHSRIIVPAGSRLHCAHAIYKTEQRTYLADTYCAGICRPGNSSKTS